MLQVLVAITLNLPLLYVLWLEMYCQISPNKNRLPNLWHVTSILVCCIFDFADQKICSLPPGSLVRIIKKNQSKYIIKWAMDIQAYPTYPLTQPLGPKSSRIAALLFRTHSFPLRRKHETHENTITQNYTGCFVLLWKWPLLVPFVE